MEEIRRTHRKPHKWLGSIQTLLQLARMGGESPQRRSGNSGYLDQRKVPRIHQRPNKVAQRGEKAQQPIYEKTSVGRKRKPTSNTHELGLGRASNNGKHRQPPKQAERNTLSYQRAEHQPITDPNPRGASPRYHGIRRTTPTPQPQMCRQDPLVGGTDPRWPPLPRGPPVPIPPRPLSGALRVAVVSVGESSSHAEMPAFTTVQPPPLQSFQYRDEASRVHPEASPTPDAKR